MSITNLILFLINSFLSYSLPTRQPNKVDNRNTFGPKSGTQDLIVTHHYCSPSISQLCSIISSIRLANIRSNRQTFKTSQHKFSYSQKYEHFKNLHKPYMQNTATKKAFDTKFHLREVSGLIPMIGMFFLSHRNWSSYRTWTCWSRRHQYIPQMIQFDFFKDLRWLISKLNKAVFNYIATNPLLTNTETWYIIHGIMNGSLTPRIIPGLKARAQTSAHPCTRRVTSKN